MKNRSILLTCMLCASLFLTACGRDDTSDKNNVVLNEEKAESKYQTRLNMVQPQAYSSVEGIKLEKGSYISIIGKAEDSTYWDEIAKGAEDAVKALNEQLGYEGKDKIKVTYNGPSYEGDVDEQINILDEELDRYPAALAIAPIDRTACEVQFDLATENDIPIVEFDSGSDYQGIMAKVMTNNKEAGMTAADKMASLIDEQGEVLLFVQDNKSTSAQDRESGIKGQIQAHYPQIQISGTYYMDDLEELKKMTAEKLTEKNKANGSEEEVTADSVTEEQVMAQILEQHPNAKGCIATSGEVTEKVLDMCEAAGKEDMKIIGFDGGENLTEALDEGSLDGLIIQNPYGIGYATVVASARSALDMGNEAFVDTGYAWVTKENMEETAIKNMLYE